MKDHQAQNAASTPRATTHNIAQGCPGDLTV